jgi:hypothetical protein
MRSSCPEDPQTEDRELKFGLAGPLIAVGAGIAIFAHFFLGALAGQGLLYTQLFARLQVERVPLHFLNDVFCLDLTFKPAQRVLQRLAFLHTNFCQSNPPVPLEKRHITRLPHFGEIVGPGTSKMAVLAREARFHLAGRISLIATGHNAGYKPNTQLLTSRREGLIGLGVVAHNDGVAHHHIEIVDPKHVRQP